MRVLANIIKFIKWFIFAGLLFFVIIAGGLLLTHNGNVYLLTIVQKVEPRLTIELEQGTLINSPIFTQIGWNDKNTEISLNKVSYQFDWSCLFNNICLQQLDIGSGQIMVSSSSQKSTVQQSQQVDFELPVAFAIKNINANNIEFTVNNIAGKFDTLNLQAQGKGNNIRVSSTINGISVILAENSSVAPLSTSPIKNNPIDVLPALLSEQDLPEIMLPFNIKLAPLTVTNLRIIQGKDPLLILNNLTLQSEYRDSQLTIESLTVDLPETDMQVTGDINLRGKYPLNLHANGMLKSIKQLEPADLLSKQHYDLKITGDLSQLKTELSLTNKLSVKLTSEVDLFRQNLPYSLDLDWQNLRWPLTGTSQYNATKGSLHSSGHVNDYQINLESDYIGEGIPSGVMSLIGRGNLQQFNIEKLLVNTLKGSAQLRGLLGWRNAIKWDGRLILDKLALDQIDPKYSGYLSGLIKQNAEIVRDSTALRWKFTIPEMDINGQFLQQPFAINGALSGDNKQGIFFDNVTVNNAQNHALINGALSKKSNLDIDLDINDFTQIIAGGMGAVQGQVQIYGPQDDLDVIAKIQGKSLAYQSMKLASFNLNSEIKATKQPIVRLNLLAENLLIADKEIERIKLDIRPSSANKTHQVDLLVKEKQASAALQMLISQNVDSWVSRLTKANINVSDYFINLDHAVTMTLDADSVGNNNLVVSSHCWDITNSEYQDKAHLCADNIKLGERGGLDVTLNKVPIAIVNPFLPDNATLSGELMADAKIHWNDISKPQFDIKVFSQNMLINLKKVTEVTTYPVDTFNITLVNQGKESDLNASFIVPNLITTHLQTQLSENREQIEGALKVALSDLSPLMALSPQIEKLSGALDADLTIYGSLQKPSIDGKIEINNSSLYVIGSPFKVNGLNTVLNIKNNNALLNGEFYTAKYDNYKAKKNVITHVISFVDKSVKSVGEVINQSVVDLNEGKATISGNLNWQNKFQGNIYLSANKITVNDYDKVNLLISPDLHLAISDSLQLSGSVVINKGTITVKELADQGVALSKDIVIVDAENKTQATTFPLLIDLKVDLGDSLKVNALGLDATVSGNLQLRKRLNKSPTLYGTLIPSDGTYTVLSQELILQDSEIVFQGSTTTPYISIKAIRDTDETDDDVTVGVKVIGTPDNLALTLYSDPEMEQQEMLSYLIQGQSLENSSGSGSQMSSVLLALQLGAANSFGVLNEIGNQLGIEDLSVSSSGRGDEQSVGLSGYIAPRVELSYGIGVFDNFSIFTIRYEMFERFYIEASSGLDQAIDAYYQFDWD